MFLTMLGASLVVGASLLAAASFSEGALVAAKSAAQVIGWLLLLSTLISLAVLRRGHLAGIGAAAVSLAGGLGVLYFAHFRWDEVEHRALRRTAAQPLPFHALDYKFIAPAALVVPVSAPQPIVRLEERVPPLEVAARAVPPPAPADACASLAGVEFLKCRRCGDTSGIARITCDESARLEYCEGRPADDALCPSPIPASYPG